MQIPSRIMAALVMALALAAQAAPIESLIPSDAMAVYVGRPGDAAATQPAGGVTIGAWVGALQTMGVIPDQGRVIADVFATLPLLNQREHLLALLDITSQRVGLDSYRLKDMQAVLVLDSVGIEAQLSRRVRDLLAAYTDADNGSIDAVDDGNVKYFQLRDDRAPNWSVVEWGQLGDWFVVAFGEGAFARVLDASRHRAGALDADKWHARAKQECHGGRSRVSVYVNLRHLRDRVGEVVLDKPTDVLESLGLGEMERLFWTVGYEDRAMRSEAAWRAADGRDYYRMLTGPAVNDARITAMIPGDAQEFGLFTFPLTSTFHDAQQAYLHTQSDETTRLIREGWARFEKQHAFNAERDVVQRLGDHLLFHTYPRHPMAAPLLCTIWIQYTGPRQPVADAINAMMQVWADQMNPPEEQGKMISLRPRVARTKDDIWYLQLGLVGPAVGVAEGWIVVSFSPHAVRANLAHLARLNSQAKVSDGGPKQIQK